jgi:hypothetical protein
VLQVGEEDDETMTAMTAVVDENVGPDCDEQVLWSSTKGFVANRYHFGFGDED